MNKLFQAILTMSQVDENAHHETRVHQLHPFVKIIMTFLMLICILSTKSIIELFIYLLIVFFVTMSCHVSIKKLCQRGLLGLPLCLCLGVSYLLINRTVINFYGFQVIEGIVLCMLLFLKTFLCLGFAYLLIVTTSFDDIACELVYMKIPSIFVLQLVMTYRYIYLLLEEAALMSRAYLLRSVDDKAIQMKDMGSFVGHLLINSMKQSQAVYHCMECRGFDIETTYLHHQKIESDSIFLMMIGIGILIIIKVVCL